VAFEIPEATMEAKQSRGFEDDRGAKQPARVEEQGPKSEEQTVGRAQFGRMAAGAVQNQKLVLKQQILGQKGFAAPGPEEHGDLDEQVHEQDDGDFHERADWVAIDSESSGQKRRELQFAMYRW
jgi:hypothetical protein